jgi:tetratricopeptide (TPR) repeat protein
MWTGDDQIANAMVWRGIGHLLNIEREMAFTFFTAAVKQDTTLFAPHVFLSWASSGEIRDHHKMLAQKLVANKNEASKLYVSLMETKRGQEGAEERRAIWKKMHMLAPEGPFIHLNYARSLQDPQAQIAELEKLIITNDKNDRNNDYVHNMLGYIYYGEGNKEKAKMHFDKYLALRPDGYNSYDSMADFYRQEGDYDSALKYYEMALDKYPAAISAINRIEEIEGIINSRAVMRDLPEVFSAMRVNVKEGHSIPEVVNNVRAVNHGMKEYGKGLGTWISYGDRGDRAGKLSMGFAFSLKENRDYYFPKADEHGQGANPQFTALTEKMADAGIHMRWDLTDVDGGYTDYVCVGFDDLIDPQLGGLVAVRPLMVKSDAEASFEKFVSDELYPAFAKNLPGVHAFVYKADRGENKGGYILLWSFDSVDRRNGYFPTAEGNPSEAFTKEYEQLGPVNEKMRTFLSEAPTAGSYTDYISIDVGN